MDEIDVQRLDEEILQTFDHLTKADYYDSAIEALRKVAVKTNTETALKAAEVIKKYNNFEIADVINRCVDHVASLDYDELLLDQAYESIQKSKNPQKRMFELLTNVYSNVRKKVDLDLSYDHLELILQTYEFVLDIHQERNTDDRVKILDGFYQELNRSVAQGRNYKEKVELLEQYCNEVKQRVQDEASELMVMHNG